jgi:hypothetical protein
MLATERTAASEATRGLLKTAAQDAGSKQKGAPYSGIIQRDGGACLLVLRRLHQCIVHAYLL